MALCSDGHTLFVEGIATGATTFQLGVAGIQGTGDQARVEVVTAVFSEAADHPFGFDDMDGDRGKFAHVSVKSGVSTQVRLRLAGAFQQGIFITSDNPAVAAPKPTSPLLDDANLTIDGMPGHQAAHTLVGARLGSPTGPLIAAVGVHVYREREVNVHIMRVEDRLSPPSFLGPGHSLAAVEERMNAFLRQLVTHVRVFDGNQQTGQIPTLNLRYDLDGDGFLFLEPDSTVDEVTAFFKPITTFTNTFAIFVVKRIKLGMKLAVAAPRGSTQLTVLEKYGTSANFLERATTLELAGGEVSETVTRTSPVEKFTIQIAAPLQNSFDAGTFLQQPIGGLASGVMREDTEEMTAVIAAHEVCHHFLDLRDTSDPGNLMFSDQAQQGRLRFKHVNSRFRIDGPKPQRQWDAPKR